MKKQDQETPTPSNNGTSEIVRIPFRGDFVDTMRRDGKIQVALKPALECLGIDFPTQLRKLRTRSWATVGQGPTVGLDGKKRTMIIVPLRTFLMFLATINEELVADEIKPKLVVWQAEIADIIEAHYAQADAGVPPPLGAEYVEALRAQLERLEAELVRVRASAKRVGMTVEQLCDAAERAELETNPLYRAKCRQLIDLVAEHEGVSKQRVQGAIRREFRVVSYLRLTISQYVNGLHGWLEARLHTPKPKGLPMASRDERQQWLTFGPKRGDA